MPGPLVSWRQLGLGVRHFLDLNVDLWRASVTRDIFGVTTSTEALRGDPVISDLTSYRISPAYVVRGFNESAAGLLSFIPLLPRYGTFVFAHLIFQYPGPSHSGTLYPATVLQLLRAQQPHPRSNFFLDGIELNWVLRKMFPDNKSSYMHHLGHLRCMYC